jgi:hypothetical protein
MINLLSILGKIVLRTAARTRALWSNILWLLPEPSIDLKYFLSIPHTIEAMSSLTKATTSFTARQHGESTVSRPSCFGHLRGQNKLKPKRTFLKAVFGGSRF